MLAAALGCGVAGAFVPAVAYRLAVPYGQPARRDCAACGAPLAAGARGWVAARCGYGHRLGVPRWLTASVAGSAGGLLGAALGPVAVLPIFLALTVLGVLLGVVDVACQRLPDQVVLPALAATPVLLGAVAGRSGAWDDWWRGLLACLVVGLVLTGMVLLPGGGLGVGDAKVGALLGWYLGWLGWEAVVLGVVLPWVVNVPVLLVLLATRRVGWRTAMPFGPALLVGALLAVPAVTWWPALAAF
ncbi:prepilin peptidase [Micromonospora inyonensis]|uniref:Leader peptidase (Prepilin peptidase) / N-methyltransferase n=1 Tax=Micromonospora inyonensis TaxID=47866 RepID=A0A1C6RBJ8_9ACTN|nr:prepilin peptidase [Micromonospora inyonensis]SCL14528.1 leader peptidase (prepilin peptidase) / N-methyltransferase [Micromonospora inyonensis]